jgi:hypothetical protein
MAEPFLERLNRFTPDAGLLDRDALLFAAGRSSARPNRGWMALAGLLLATQSLSLVLLWPHPTTPSGGLPLPVASMAPPHAALEPPRDEASLIATPWSTRHRLRQSGAEGHPGGDLTLIESGPPLRAFPRPPSLSN